MVILPNEIINLILFKYLDDIEIRINFGYIRKLNVNKFNFLNKIIRDNIYSFSLFYKKNSCNFVYKYININKKQDKFYRITYEYENNSDKIWIRTEVCNSRIPMYTSLISEI